MKLVDKSYTIIFLRRSACIKVTSCKLYFERERERERGVFSFWSHSS